MALPSPQTYSAVFDLAREFQESRFVSHYALSALACMEELAALHHENELAAALRRMRAAVLNDPAFPRTDLPDEIAEALKESLDPN